MRLLLAVASLLLTSSAGAQTNGHPISGPRDALFSPSSELSRDTGPSSEDVQTHMLWTDSTTGAYGRIAGE